MNTIPLCLSGLLVLVLSACSRSETGDAHEDSGDAVVAEIEAPEHTGPIPGIVTRAAAAHRLGVIVSTYGTLALNAERTRQVSARFPGVVTRVLKSAGDRVAAGDTLLTVESNESMQVYAVKSPIAGTITLRNVNAGESVEAQALFTVSDLASLWAELTVFPRDVARVRVGQDVWLVSSDGARRVRSKIAHVSPLGSAGTQAVTVRALVPNPDGDWRPGLNVTAHIQVEQIEVPVAVEAGALQTVDGERAVFVPHENGFAPRPVQTGRSDDEFVEILAGLAAGEAYVARDSFLVKAELEKAGAEHEH